MPSRSRVLIADDHNLMAELCKKLLETEFDVVGTVGDGHAVVRAASTLRPDVIILDIAMHSLNGLDAGEQVRKSQPKVKLVYLTVNADPDIAAEAFRRGASAYLLKTCAASDLVTAVRDALRGKSYMSRSLPKEHIRYLERQGAKKGRDEARLTEREREVLQLLAEGKVMKEVANVLGTTTRTVAFHKYRMMEVLGIKTSAELVRYAVRNNILAA